MVLLLLITLILIVALKGASVKLVAPLGFVIFAIIRALWVRIPPPEGTPLKPDEAPELFDLVAGALTPRVALGAGS